MLHKLSMEHALRFWSKLERAYHRKEQVRIRATPGDPDALTALARFFEEVHPEASVRFTTGTDVVHSSCPPLTTGRESVYVLVEEQ